MTRSSPPPPKENQPVQCKSLLLDGHTVYYTGPDLDEGCLPAFFYFSISGEESLCLDPFNQVIAYLPQEQIRCFSLTLPAHGEGFDKKIAVDLWNQWMDEGQDPLSPFLAQCKTVLEKLVQDAYIDTQRLFAGGLSRGAFIACHFAAQNPDVSQVLGFAPMTQMRSNSDIAKSLNLIQIVPALLNKKLQFYIGNCDSCVKTDRCFAFIHELAQASQASGIRSPNVSLEIYPSIGHRGHGTPPEIFYSGAQWLMKSLSSRKS